MRTAVIDGDGVVTNIIEAERDFADSIGAIQSDTAQIGWVWGGEAFAPPALSLDDLRAAKIAAVNAKIDAILAGGAPVAVGESVLHVSLSDGSRADLTAMATTAVAAASGAVPWPDSYQTGWITVENIRIPLSAPATGLGLAAGVGDFYAQVRRHGRDLKDAVLMAEDAAALDAVDMEAGWPA